MENSTDLLNLIFHTSLILTPFYLLYVLNKYNIQLLKKSEFDLDNMYDSEDSDSENEPILEKCSISSSDSGLESDSDTNSDSESDDENSINGNCDSSEKSSIDMIPVIQDNYLTDELDEKIHDKIKTILDELSEL